MAGAPIKFRCYQCNQLLGVSRSKVGSIVSCPKCATDLIVPEPGETIPSGAPSSPLTAETPMAVGQPTLPETTREFLSAVAAGVPIEVADIRPEDIRVEPSIVWSPPSKPSPEPEAAVNTEPSSLAAPPPSTPESVELPFLVSPVPGEELRIARAPQTSSIETHLPPLKFDPPSLAPERAATPRTRDLVLPRSVVAAWSLFVLVAQALAFIAGLLAGHYIWRVH
jgi:hypothetical protein